MWMEWTENEIQQMKNELSFEVTDVGEHDTDDIGVVAL